MPNHPDGCECWYERMEMLAQQPRTKSQKIVVAVLADLGDRRSIKWALQDIDSDVVNELLSTLVRKVDEVLDAD